MSFGSRAVIDVDAHLTEPPDLWTSRVPPRWRDAVPHVERVDGRDLWVAGNGAYTSSPGMTATAGYDGLFPGPATFGEMHPAAYDAEERIALLDAQGIQAQMLYPNVGGFGAAYWVKLGDPQLALECVRAYNDFLTEFCSIAPDRLLAPTAVPFWDIDATRAEIERGQALGHRAVNFCAQPETLGLPWIWDRHWDPVWSLAQEAGIPVNFHIGSGDIAAAFAPHDEVGVLTNLARAGSTLFVNNTQCIANLIFGGVCHRFPELALVSVESGVGFIPAALEHMDWQWRFLQVRHEHPEYDLLPSEYFRRQIYACFWFERTSVPPAIALLPDNLLYETDFPHPASQYPTPNTPAVEPASYVDDTLTALPDEALRKVLFENAARLYRVASRAA